MSKDSQKILGNTKIRMPEVHKTKKVEVKFLDNKISVLSSEQYEILPQVETKVIKVLCDISNFTDFGSKVI